MVHSHTHSWDIKELDLIDFVNPKGHSSLAYPRGHSSLALVEIVRRKTKQQPEKRFYVVWFNRGSNQVESAVPADMPVGGGTWVANICCSGIHYVAQPRTRATARRWYRKLRAELQRNEKELDLADAYWASSEGKAALDGYTKFDKEDAI
jgi:hypothetical protein